MNRSRRRLRAATLRPRPLDVTGAFFLCDDGGLGSITVASSLTDSA